MKARRKRASTTHPVTINWPVTGVIPLTAAEDIEARAWSYADPRNRDVHVQIIRISDNVTLTQMRFRVPR